MNKIIAGSGITYQHFWAIIYSADDAIISKTLDGVITSWNQGAETIFGYTEEEMIGVSINRLLPVERPDEEATILARIILGEKIKNFETIRVRKDGQQIHVSVTISPLFDCKGQIIGASKISRDITSQRLAQSRMLLMDRIFSNTSEAILVSDDRAIILEVNSAFTEITGYAREEVIGQHLSLFRSGRQGPGAYLDLFNTLNSTGSCQGEIWSRRKNGNTYAVLLTASRLPDPNNGPSKYVALFSDVTALRQQQEKNDWLVHFDALTSLPNRLLLLDRLKQAVGQAARNENFLAVVYLDLDNFSMINDTYGHDVGDVVMIEIARRISAAVKEGDTVARFGGDEFVLVLVDIRSIEQCALILDRVIQACNEPVVLSNAIVSSSASLGVSVYPNDYSDADQLIRHADQMMMEAKRCGKNQYQFFDQEKDVLVKQLAANLAELSHALFNDEFVLYYQPKVNMREATLIGAEALIRWQHPSRGTLPPSEFLAMLDAANLTVQLGEWVIHAALKQLSDWNAAGFVVKVSINISPDHLKMDNFCAHLLSQFQQFPSVLPQQLELEIVESSAISDINIISRTIDICRGHGIHFSLDDFGTAYSSLTYMRRLNVDTIKIDQSFVRDMLTDADDLAIVTAVIGLSKMFHRQVLAEGVESKAHGNLLLELGCELAQGYGIARPMSAARFPDWAKAWAATPGWEKL